MSIIDIVNKLFTNEVKQAENDAYKAEAIKLAKLKGIARAKKEYRKYKM